MRAEREDRGRPTRLRRGFRRLAIAAFIVLMPLAAWSLWDYVEARRLAALVREIKARGETVDHRSDIFSFGCVLYEMLAGRQAFDGKTVSDLLASVLAREPEHREHCECAHRVSPPPADYRVRANTEQQGH